MAKQAAKQVEEVQESTGQGNRPATWLHQGQVEWILNTYGEDLEQMDAASVITMAYLTREDWKKSDEYRALREAHRAERAEAGSRYVPVAEREGYVPKKRGRPAGTGKNQIAAANATPQKSAGRKAKAAPTPEPAKRRGRPAANVVPATKAKPAGKSTKAATKATKAAPATAAKRGRKAKDTVDEDPFS